MAIDKWKLWGDKYQLIEIVKCGNRVISAKCRFCKVFRMEKKRTRDGSRRIWVYEPGKKGWRPRQFHDHVSKQHPDKWREFCDEKTDKSTFWKESSRNGTLDHYDFIQEDGVTFDVSNSIVDIIIQELLSDGGEVNKDIFQITEKGYQIRLKKPYLFQAVVTLVATGLSFRQIDKTITDLSKLPCVVSALLKGCSERFISQCTQQVCAISLQALAVILSMAWAFSLAIDITKHQGTSYLGIRCRVLHNGKITDYHLIVIPIFEKHRAEVLLNYFTRFMDAFLSDWRLRLIGICTDEFMIKIQVSCSHMSYSW